LLFDRVNQLSGRRYFNKKIPLVGPHLRLTGINALTCQNDLY